MGEFLQAGRPAPEVRRLRAEDLPDKVILIGAVLAAAEAGHACSASAMAAGALVHLKGGNADQICHAVAMALKNLMGLVCDPVAGLVEVPCIKRNVIGAVNAIAAADMALAGIESRIPVDEVIDAMGEVGRRLPVELRETALGGLAATPTGKAVKKQLHGDKKKQRTLTIKDSRWKLERPEDPTAGDAAGTESAKSGAGKMNA